ncbi:von Willebrand factor A domain-containing protein 5A-like isoform X2 [Eriocheir sinensis]|uniref:von Willebrand factor A domain-containing protein 5A-like isoform X2 n=1 Tax=Eriocheir sinensis TaxID=95602 RepID=UPI0021C5CA15|nr:von Willebrand factor A domain-containing protein 5A-like isoform X2 [Eriocheir sinensis]
MAATDTLPPHLSRYGLMGCCEGKQGSSWSILALESVSTEVRIRGFVAQVCAKLVYLNNSPETLQVQAVYPVDEGAAVYQCEVCIGGRTIVTHCMEKKKAEKEFEKAVKAGHRAVIAREHGDSCDIFKLNLGNFPSASRAEITLKMVMELKVQTDGGISFVLPTVLNPRYCPPDTPMRDISTRAILGLHIVHVPKPYSIDVKATVSGSHKIARIISSTDGIITTLADDALSAQVGQDGGFKCDHDWSFLVYYNNPYAPHLLRETGDRSATGLMKDDLLMLNFFPEVPENTYSNKNEVIFIIDRSGSMQGDKIKNARTTLLLFLKSLPAGCLFNVVSFGSDYSLLFPEGSRTYTEETLKIALNLQATMDADMGGTEILKPLQSIYSKPLRPGYYRQIILITDGEVWNVSEVCQLVRRHAHETRLFSVGVGHGASTALVRGTARAGRGRSEMVAEESHLQQKVMGLLSSMLQESVQEVTIACEVEPPTQVKLVPKVPPVIFGGQHLILYARVPATTQVKNVTVRGQLGTKPLLSTVEGQQVTTVHDEAKSLHRLAARAQLLQWELDEEDDVAEDMVLLSTASGVVCQRTALVGIDQESGQPVAQSFEEMQEEYTNVFRGGGAPRSAMMCRTKKSTAPKSAFNSFGRASEPPAPPQQGGPAPFSFCSAAEPFREAPDTADGGDCEGLPANKSALGVESESVESATCGRSRRSRSRSRSRDRSVIVDSPSPSPVEQPSGLLGVVSLQQFDGSWTLKDAAELTGMPFDALSASNPAKGEVAWATALVLVLLERKYGHQREQWALLATKAQTFITGCGEQVEELLAKARDTLQAQ